MLLPQLLHLLNFWKSIIYKQMYIINILFNFSNCFCPIIFPSPNYFLNILWTERKYIISYQFYRMLIHVAVISRFWLQRFCCWLCFSKLVCCFLQVIFLYISLLFIIFQGAANELMLNDIHYTHFLYVNHSAIQKNHSCIWQQTLVEM